MWNRKVEPRCVGSLPSCLGPLMGVYENRGAGVIRQDDSFVRLFDGEDEADAARAC